MQLSDILHRTGCYAPQAGVPQSSGLSSPRHTEKPEHLQCLLRTARGLAGRTTYSIPARMYQAIERVHDLTVTDDHHTDAAHAGRALIGCLEINCCKICHTLHIFVNANV